MKRLFYRWVASSKNAQRDEKVMRYLRVRGSRRVVDDHGPDVPTWLRFRGEDA